MPKEIMGGRRSQEETHPELHKKLLEDVSNIKKNPTTKTCAVSINFYDIVACHYASLCAQHFVMDLNYLILLLKTIQCMKMHLHTVFGVSTAFYTSECKPFKGEL